jgi:hypothetical protein
LASWAGSVSAATKAILHTLAPAAGAAAGEEAIGAAAIFITARSLLAKSPPSPRGHLADASSGTRQGADARHNHFA